ncbi:TIGR02996 domain-containing protein [Gemmata sp.]
MSDGDALFRALLASPEDTTLRLADADWLSESFFKLLKLD